MKRDRLRNMSNIADKLGDIKPKYIHAVILILVIIPLLVPLKLPLSVSPLTRKAFDTINALKPGDVVLFSNDFGADTLPSNIGQAAVMLNHLMSLKGVKVVIISFLHADGMPIFELYVRPRVNFNGKVYGQDWVNLGWIPGFEVGMSAFAKGIKQVVSKDYYGTPISDLPMMKNINVAEDFKLVITFVYIEEYIRQFNNPYKLPIILGGRAIMISGQMAYVSTGQIVSILNDAIGAAEYEVLLNTVGYGRTFLDAMTVVLIYAILLVVLANVSYLLSKRTPKKVNQ